MAKVIIHELNVKTVSYALGIFGLVNGIIAWIFHGALRVPSIASTLFPWFNWFNPMHIIGMIIVLTISGLFYGALFTWIYNYIVKKR